MYARQHSRLLLQVKTTNPIEAWHCRLKYGYTTLKSCFSLLGCVVTTNEKAVEVNNLARKAAAEVHTKKSSRLSFPL